MLRVGVVSRALMLVFPGSNALLGVLQGARSKMPSLGSRQQAFPWQLAGEAHPFGDGRGPGPRPMEAASGPFPMEAGSGPQLCRMEAGTELEPCPTKAGLEVEPHPTKAGLEAEPCRPMKEARFLLPHWWLCGCCHLGAFLQVLACDRAHPQQLGVARVLWAL